MSWRDRILADSTDRDAWQRARAHVIGASDAASLAKLESVPLYLASKLKSDTWQGNAFSRHGHEMEPGLLGYLGYEQNTYLIAHAYQSGFACTPDGIKDLPDGKVRLAQAKTSIKPLIGKRGGLPLTYRRQVAWEQFVMDADQTDFVWAEHDGDFHLKDIDPHVVVIDRDDDLIRDIVTIATPLLAAMRAALAFEKELAA